MNPRFFHLLPTALVFSVFVFSSAVPISSQEPGSAQKAATTPAPQPPQAKPDDFERPVIAEFNFSAKNEGTVGQLCRELATRAGAKTRIYVSEQAMVMRVPDMSLRNVRVDDVLDLVKSAVPGAEWLWEWAPNAPRTNTDNTIMLNEYYVGLRLQASDILCHLYRLPEQVPDTKGGKPAEEYQGKALHDLFMLILTEAHDAINFRDSERRKMTHDVLPMVEMATGGLTMELHRATRLLVAVGTQENIALSGVIIKALGGEDLGDGQQPVIVPAPAGPTPKLGTVEIKTDPAQK